MTADFETKLAREFKVSDDQTNSVVMANEQVSCKALNAYYTACEYYLSPENQRFGLLMTKGARGLLTYQARWVRA